MQTELMREEQLNVRLNPEEAARFKRVADHFGLSPAAMIRMLVKEKARELGFEHLPFTEASQRIIDVNVAAKREQNAHAEKIRERDAMIEGKPKPTKKR